MKLSYLIVLAVMLLSVITASAGDGNEKVRVLARTDKEVTDAVSKGCAVVKEVKNLKALVCSKDAASSLGLQEDIRLYAIDAGANTQIGADIVHASGNTGAGRKVVILDTGYNYLHPELSSSYLGGKDFVNNDNDPMDDHGHGSHVAGIITADGINANAKGVAPNASIIAGKVLNASGEGNFIDILAAMYWAVDGPDGIPETSDDFNADAISMSMGTSPPYTFSGFCNRFMPEMTDAIRYADRRGVLVVVAAGNDDGAGVSFPGCIRDSTTVGAVNSADVIAGFSGIGRAVDITAPGIGIFSTGLGTSYFTASGTSMATPMVSGVVALVKSAHPEYNVHQTQGALFRTAIDLGDRGKDEVYGNGRVDAFGAVNS